MRSDVIIVGSGIAALQLAKQLSRDLHVIIFTKDRITTSNSYLAQGGIAAALSNKDDIYKHLQDTLEAGRFHNNIEAVSFMTKEAPDLIKELIEDGCSFDHDEKGSLKLGLEGAHCEKRIVHSGGDSTGRMVIDFLQTQSEHITIYENITVYDLILSQNRCIGVKVKNEDDNTIRFFADHVVLATGGLGQIYSYTSNSETVTGDGLAFAFRAGAELTDMEFIQFHPTLLNVDGKGVGLVSEAVRGEGARLVTEEGILLMDGVHPYKDLAPRHVVSQTIYHSIKQGHSVYLDISSIKDFSLRFPTVASICVEHGIDYSQGKLPVIPGCHFLMGGIRTDLNGQTTIPGLYAIGEVAYTGVHGANRLASNSLLEGLYFGKRLAQWINTSTTIRNQTFVDQKKKGFSLDPSTLPEVSIIKSSMMDGAGIVRSKENLKNQLSLLETYSVEQWMESDLDHLSKADLNKVFMLICSWLVTNAALQREESRGGHLRQDYPNENIEWEKQQIILQKKGDRIEQIEAALTT